MPDMAVGILGDQARAVPGDLIHHVLNTGVKVRFKVGVGVE